MTAEPASGTTATGIIVHTIGISSAVGVAFGGEEMFRTVVIFIAVTLVALLGMAGRAGYEAYKKRQLGQNIGVDWVSLGCATMAAPFVGGLAYAIANYENITNIWVIFGGIGTLGFLGPSGMDWLIGLLKGPISRLFGVKS